MKTQKRILLLLATILICGFSIAQSSIQSQKEEGIIETSRLEDIKIFKEYMMVISNAAGSDASEEIKSWMGIIVDIAAVEIARTKKNQQDLKDGKTEQLEKWQKKNYPDQPLNVNREIQILDSRIKHEEFLHDRLKNYDLSNLSESRNASALRGTMNSFKRDMEKNLKYDAEPKPKSPPPPPKGGSINSGNIKSDGPVIVVKSGGDSIMKTGDPRLNDFYKSKKTRNEEYQAGQEMFQKYLNDGDDKMAKKAFKMLYEVMMNEVNANSWLLSMIKAGGIQGGDDDVNKLTNTISQQNVLMKQAEKLKAASTSDFGGNKNEIAGLINNFAQTL